MTAALSPYAQTMGFVATRDDEDRIILLMDFDDDKSGRPGFIHGGALAGLLETTAYMTVIEVVGEGPRLKPINCTMTYMRAGVEKRTYARATIERLGKRIANVEVIAWQEDPNKPIAMAQINVLIDRAVQPASENLRP
ncbi:MAG: hypothetical protein RIS52_1641 [Pseudomonadota bacterium]|jgi:uncharacterized protein (TIGR00369 family)